MSMDRIGFNSLRSWSPPSTQERLTYAGLTIFAQVMDSLSLHRIRGSVRETQAAPANESGPR